MRVCVFVFLFVLMLTGSIVFLVRGEKREREKTTEEKNRKGDVGLGDFQALCELRKRGGGRGKVRPLLNKLGQLAETIQTGSSTDPQSCVPQLVSGSTAGVGWNRCIVILRAAGTL